MSMTKGDKLTIVAIGAAGVGLVHVAFEETGGLFGSISQLPQYVCDSLLALTAWDAFPIIVIALGMFSVVLLTLRK
jgi:hypothetical protein